MKQLLLGAGTSRRNPFNVVWDQIITLDIDKACSPDVVWDLNVQPLPFQDGEFDELHAYEVLEHIGKQGDWRGFFREFSEYWRILKPGGLFYGSSPALKSRWLWSDPGHTRVITPELFTFLSQEEYARQVGSSSMTDYRSTYKADFLIEFVDEVRDTFAFALKAVK